MGTTSAALARTSRRRFLAGTAAVTLAATAGARSALAQDQAPAPVPAAPAAPAADAAAAAPAAPQSTPFSFDLLTEAARDRATRPMEAPAEVNPLFTDLSYDDYQQIVFRPDRARWAEDGMTWRLQPFHLGWLFEAPVRIHEVVDGQAHELTFTTDDFIYNGRLKDAIPPGVALPGVAGFKLTHPLNRADKFDEVVSFIGASYFRALGQGNTYGSSARGLAIDSGLPKAEEFPIFSGFWIEKPPPGPVNSVAIYASLDSESATGAYRILLTPGVDTITEITARLFFRKDVGQLGIAPLTSMFLFADVNRQKFDDYRPEVHDSSGLRIERADGDVIWRALDNPEKLASSYYKETAPKRFGLHQRGRDFRDYQDTESRYELRPSIDVEPVGDWGSGTVRLFEIPTDLEIHDNIGAFWIPDQPAKAGDAREFAYRLHWGMLERNPELDPAQVWATRGGIGGAAGLENPPDTHKFVVDFRGGMLGRLPADVEGIAPVVTLTGGEMDVVTLVKLPDDKTWRVTLDVAAKDGALVELNVHVAGYGRKLSEIWSFQWMKS